MRFRFAAIVALACWALMASGCVVHHRHYGGHGTSRVGKSHPGGPPPHAPAHGHRRKHQHPSAAEVAIVFDAVLGVYVVVGHPAHYWDGKRYLRWTDGRWEASAEFEGRWLVVASSSDVPPGLRKKHGHRKKHKHHPAKHAH